METASSSSKSPSPEEDASMDIGPDQNDPGSTTLTTTTNSENTQFSPNVPKFREAILQGELCRVCNDRANGFHYGVMTCEGCKAFFRRNKTKPILVKCVKGGTCEMTKNSRNCQQCRFKKCVEMGMTGNIEKEVTRKQYPTPMDLTRKNDLVNKILQAHEMACEYTEEKVRNLEVKEYGWAPDTTVDPLSNRISAWEYYSEDLDQDITSSGLFIKNLEDELTMEDRAKLLKKNAFSMYLLRITRALSSQGLQLSDGRLIRMDTLRLLYGDRLANEMVNFSINLLEKFKLTDADIAFFLTMVYYQKITEEARVEFGIRLKRPEEFDKLEKKYEHLFYNYYNNPMIGGEKSLSIRILMQKLNELDKMHKEDVYRFLAANKREFNLDSYFGEVYICRSTDQEEAENDFE